MIACLAGGVGGARLADGFHQARQPLSVVVNTGDDFVLHGLTICPDIDTVLYTLSGLSDHQRGWGLAGDSARCMEFLDKLGGETWFHLGDLDLATHLFRTQALTGASLTEVTRTLATRLGVRAEILPMSDQPVRTRVRTHDGWLDFQDYFVRRAHRDEVLELAFQGIDQARPSPAVLEALGRADRLVICPSNPFVSVEPILSLPGLRQAWCAASAPKLAVSPILGGQAVKGPAAQMLASLGHDVSSLGIARLYAGLVDVLVLDECDRELVPAIEELGLRTVVCPTLMKTPADRRALAERLLSIL
ncbi:MAG: 2-phospho-L-lactate transferase [Candidatus Eremiobacteraeota bacterium]|nr:2-phospho-L-lactate transferase [Candidatus Eremiobacteraeota bacterium]